MHGHDRAGKHDAEQEDRNAGRLAIEEEIGQHHQQGGGADAAAIAGGERYRRHDRAFPALRALRRDRGAKGSTTAVGRALGGSTSHQPS